MKPTLAAVVIAVLSLIVPASAETIGLATVKCSELGVMDQDGATTEAMAGQAY